MREKARSRQGFTLIELLAVVALIVILLAIGIPAVMGAVNSAGHKADADYERAARARATARWTTGAAKADFGDGTWVIYAYDTESGELIMPTGTNPKAGTAGGQCRKHGHSGLGLYVKLGEDGGVQLCWAQTGLSGTDPSGAAFQWDTNLCGKE